MSAKTREICTLCPGLQPYEKCCLQDKCTEHCRGIWQGDQNDVTQFKHIYYQELFKTRLLRVPSLFWACSRTPWWTRKRTTVYELSDQSDTMDLCWALAPRWPRAWVRHCCLISNSWDTITYIVTQLLWFPIDPSGCFETIRNNSGGKTCSGIT